MTQRDQLVFNPPPGWPKPPIGWSPPIGWKPDPSWPLPPPNWQLWIPDGPAGDDMANGETRPPPTGSSDTPRGRERQAAFTLDQRITFLEAENATLRARLESLGADPHNVVVLDDDRVLQDVGIYRYHHPLENAPAYQARLENISNHIAEMIRAGAAIQKSNMFTFDG